MKFLVFIGRFQPFHVAHKEIIEAGLKQADRMIVLIGSARSARSIRNPFTYEERKDVILEEFNNDPRLIIRELKDVTYNDQAWLRQIHQTVTDIVLAELNPGMQHVTLHGTSEAKVGLIGFSKDETSYYLKLFPEWKENSINITPRFVYNATSIRNEFFTETPRIADLALPASSVKFLKSFLGTEAFRYIYQEAEYVKNYKKSWESAPYPPIFQTADAVVIQSGFILMVRRKAMPGAGLLALPGGYVNQRETIENAVIRELREETRIKVPDPVLRGNIKKSETFDNPHRSARGRVITKAFLIELPPGDLPKVKGGDDAASASWVPIATLKEDELFEDHYHIISKMLGLGV